MGKGSPSTGSVFDFKPGTLQVDRPNDGVLGQPLSPSPANVSPFVSVGAAPVQTPQPTAFVSVGAAPVQTLQSPFERVLQDQRERYGGFTAAEVRQNKNREALSQAPEPAQTNITVNTPAAPISQPTTLDFSDDGGIDIQPANFFAPRPEPDPRSFVGQPATLPDLKSDGIFRALGITPALREVPDAPSGFSSLIRGAAESDAPAQSSGFGKGGTRGGSNFGRFGSRGFSKGARGYSQGGSLARSLVSLVGRQPEFQAQLANSSVPNAQQAFNTIYGIPMPEGQAQPSTIAPIISVPIPMASLGDRVVPPPSEPQQMADYDYLLNTLKPTPIYPGASFANVGLEGYNTLENIEENQGLSPFDQSQRSMITGTTTGQLSQATANPGNQEEGLANLEDTLGAMS